ncbi:hypothetical protein J1614_004673 [Plenodomus biglobosus]|nr:hypothetical protein J1614_004673 [Plenodomus biglobosus]
MIAVNGFDELVTVDEGWSVVANVSLAMLLTSRVGEKAEFRGCKNSECERVDSCSWRQAGYVQFAGAVVSVDDWRRRVVDGNSAKRGQDSRLGAPVTFHGHMTILSHLQTPVVSMSVNSTTTTTNANSNSLLEVCLQNPNVSILNFLDLTLLRAMDCLMN